MSRNDRQREDDEDEGEDEDAESSEQGEEKAKSYKPGCATVMFLIGAALVAGGVYLMNRWERMPGAGKAGAVVLVVFGTLLALPFLLLVTLKVIFKVLLGRVTREMKKAGAEMLQGNKALYEDVHRFRPAHDDDFESLDRATYDDATRQLASSGFRHLGDVVDETIEEQSGMTTVIRVLASTDGTTMAGFYHYAPPQMPLGFEGRRLLMCDLATEFTDGTFLATANTKGLDLTTAATGIDRRQHPLETPLPDLVRSHEAEKQRVLAAKALAKAPAKAASPTCVVIHTLADALQSEQRQQAVKNAFRKQIGYIDPEEVRRIAKTVDPDDGMADLSARAAEEARRKQRDA